MEPVLEQFSSLISLLSKLYLLYNRPGHPKWSFANIFIVKLCQYIHCQTRTVRGSDYSPAIELSEQKDKLVTATGDIEKYSEKQANKVWLNSVNWFSRY